MRHCFVTVLIGVLLSCAALALPSRNMDGGGAPRTLPAFMIGLSGYYFQPSGSHGDLDFASINDNNHSNNTRSIDPSYHIGWGVNASYFLCYGDINLTYLDVDTEDSESVKGNGLNAITPVNNVFNYPFAVPAYLFPSYDNEAKAEVKFKLQQLNIYAGKLFYATPRLGFHPILGIEWAHLTRGLHLQYFQSTTLLNSSPLVQQSQEVSISEINSYAGVGPLIGFDLNYEIRNSLGVVGHFKNALLIGRIRTTFDELITQRLTINPVDNVVSGRKNNFNNESRISPLAEAKLGVYWSWRLDCHSCSRLIFEAGWQVTRYYNLFDRLQTNTLIDNGFVAPIITSTDLRRFSSDVNFNGPYINLTFRA